MSAARSIPDPLDCYELCVQSPRHVAAFLRSAHGGAPVSLREDFCGTAAVSRRWCTEGKRAGESVRAVGIDLDAKTLEKARSLAHAAGVGPELRLVRTDALSAASPDEEADIIFVGNFSIGYIDERSRLVDYLRASHARLSRGNAGFGGGIFACDTYGGAGAFLLGGVERRHAGRNGEVIRYTWVHERADPLTNMVENSISFRVEIDGEVVQEWPRAFVYRWRLWSIAELAEALREAGFAGVEVYKDVNVAPGQTPRPVEDPAELGEDWIVIVLGRA